MESTKGIFFLGTPHVGSVISQSGQLAALMLQPFGSNADIIQGLQYNSTNLKSLHRRFEAIIEPATSVVNFFELQTIPRLITLTSLSANPVRTSYLTSANLPSSFLRLTVLVVRRRVLCYVQPRASHFFCAFIRESLQLEQIRVTG